MDIHSEEKLTFKDKLQTLLKDWNFSGAITITHEGGTLFQEACGMADYENKLPNTLDTTFYAPSLAKQFTAVCIMLLKEKGKLKLEDNLQTYLPEYALGEGITLRYLLNMCSGIPDYRNDVIGDRLREEKSTSSLAPKEFYIYKQQATAAPKNLSDVLNLVNDVPLQFTPGKKVQPSNTNYYFLGVIVERVSGMKLDDFMKENIFAPLNMTNTGLDLRSAEATSYGLFEEERIPLGRAEAKAGDAAIVTTTRDVNLWLQAVLEGKLLKKSSWKQSFKQYDDEYGFGWESVGSWFFNSGSFLGYSASVFVSFEKNSTITLLSNVTLPTFGPERGYTLQRNIRILTESEVTYPKAPKLMKLNNENIFQCLNLSTTKEQEDFVALNYISIGQAYVNPRIARPFLIMEGSQAIGFLMFAVDKKNNFYEIWRLMIDKHFQGRGYGKAAMKLAIDYLKSQCADVIKLSFEPDNTTAEALYRSFGFEATGEKDGDEIVMALKLF